MVAGMNRASEKRRQRVKVQSAKAISKESFASARRISKALDMDEDQVVTALFELGYEDAEEDKFVRKGTKGTVVSD